MKIFNFHGNWLNKNVILRSDNHQFYNTWRQLDTKSNITATTRGGLYDETIISKGNSSKISVEIQLAFDFSKYSYIPEKHFDELKKCDKNFNSQADGSPNMATPGVFPLSRLSVSSYSITVKDYTPRIEYRGFFEIIHFYIRRLWNPQNAFENFRQRFYFLWCLLVLYVQRLSQLSFIVENFQ